jgi:cell wall-associated NlpC family hydrolase
VHGPGYGIGRGARTKGFDCSGLAEYAYARAGILIGTTTTEQWRSGVRVPEDLLEPGDLVFYDNDRKRPGPEHVGLALDGERMVHAPYTGALVRIDPLDRPDLLGVVRPDRGRGDVEL